MSDRIDAPPVGQIRYFDRIEPALTSGQYTLRMNQQLPSELNLNQSNFIRDIDFNIQGPRWRINPANVHMRSPPKNEQGVLCDMSFPRIVFQRKTTPWERALDDESMDDEDPWMALLLIREDELEEHCSLELSEGPNGSTVKINDFVSGSDLGDDDPNRYIDALKINPSLFQRIAPTPDELPLLVHALQVNPLDKEMCGDDEDGWFSVVVSNRIPAVEDCKYYACLISLEFVSNISDTLPSNLTSDNFVPTIVPDTGGESDWTVDSQVDFDDENLRIDEELQAIYDRPNPPIPTERYPNNGNFGPAGRPPQIDEEFHKMDNGLVDESSQLKLTQQTFDNMGIDESITDEMIGAGGRKRNLFSAFDVLLANPFSGFLGNRKRKSEPNQTTIESQKSMRNPSKGIATTVSPKDIEKNNEYLGIHSFNDKNDDPTQTYLDSSNAPTVSGPQLVFPLLHHWTFKTGNGGDFEARMRGLRVRSHIDEDEAVGELGSIASKSDGTYAPALLGNDMVPDVAINSYVTMEIAGDDGIRRTGYYRGPCIAVPTNHEIRKRPYHNSDEAKGLDLETGRDEISHSAAFELGRLLGMSDPGFIRAINRWRRLRYVDVQDFEEFVMIKDLFEIDQVESLSVKNLLTKHILTEKCLAAELAEIERNHGLVDPLDIDGGYGPAGDPIPEERFEIREDLFVEEYDRFVNEFVDTNSGGRIP